MAVALFLLAASHVAGLHVETHACQEVRVFATERVVRHATRAFPVHIVAAGAYCAVRGLPGPVLAALREAHRVR
eukprot:7401169-Alexandrium_andersonii.AAC.1